MEDPNLRRRHQSCAMGRAVGVLDPAAKRRRLENGDAADDRERRWSTSSSSASLATIFDCYQPLTYEIANFLADTPVDLVHFCGLSAHLVEPQSKSILVANWELMFLKRWPAFYDCLKFHGATDWYSLYRDTLLGRIECMLEVFDREKKAGFAMAAMVARVMFDNDGGGAYVAKYVSATKVPAERIPVQEQARLRFCPKPARARLHPCHSLPATEAMKQDDAYERCGGSSSSACDEGSWRVNSAAAAATMAMPGSGSQYPYKVLEGIEGLKIGEGVELQWKMQLGSPFGWWYGHLEDLERHPDGQKATATITFRHFPAASRWYRLRVVVGDGEMRPCTFGGYTGGLQPVVDEAAQRRWMQFFPRLPVTFP